MPPPSLCLALCQNLPPLQQRSSRKRPVPALRCLELKQQGGAWGDSGEREQPRGAWGDSREREQPRGARGNSGEGDPRHAAGPAAAPEQSPLPAASISSALGVTAHVAAEGLPVPQLPQFAGGCVAQTADEEKLAASHLQKHPRHQYGLLPFPGCSPARLTLAQAEPRHVQVWRRKTKTKHPTDIPKAACS